MGKIMTHHGIFWESMRVPQIDTNPNCKIIMAILHPEFMMNPSEFGFNDHTIIIFQNDHLPMNSSHHESQKKCRFLASEFGARPRPRAAP
jgi:hypothetical protein